MKSRFQFGADTVTSRSSRLAGRALAWLAALSLGLAAPPGALRGEALSPHGKASPGESVLVLYDSSGPSGWIGGLHARMLGNLLGHFRLDYRIAPVESYRAGSIARVGAVFYFGTVYDNPLPDAFLEEALQADKPVCWFKYNLWQLGAGSRFGQAFEARAGFRFEFMDLSGHAVIGYKGETFGKNALDPELGRTTIVDAGRARAVATACDGTGSNCIPYLVEGGHFWYVADSPFDYIDEEDRYLVFADALHDILRVTHRENHRALIRLEDIDPAYPTGLLRQAAEVLHAEGVPFLISLVPVYADPLGTFNGGEPEVVLLSRSPDFAATLRYMQSLGGQIVLHGYTHQYDSVPNPYNGVTGDDYEFFRVRLDAQNNVVEYGPVPEDSRHWAEKRVHDALRQLKAARLSAVAWQTPHYAASPVDYTVFADAFRLTNQRALYFDGPGPFEDRHGHKPGGSADPGHFAGQFFPYVIEHDLYGQKIIPENVGNVITMPSAGAAARLPADVVRAAKKNLAVRDGWAGAYFHPFLDPAYLRELVRGVRGLGYEYVPLSEDLE